MQQDRALDELPETYASALRLREAGVDDAAIARRLCLEPAALGTLLRIGTAKLEAILIDGGARDGQG